MRRSIRNVYVSTREDFEGEVAGISKMRRARDEKRRKGEGRIRERRGKEKDDESFPLLRGFACIPGDAHTSSD